jgi:DNA-binding PadR family transcriptional regulator
VPSFVVATGDARSPGSDYQLNIVQEVLLALLAAEPTHAYRLRAQVTLALGPLAASLNDGQVYVTLTRLEKAGLVVSAQVTGADRPARKVYELTGDGRARVDAWLQEVDWSKPAPAGFHLKLVAAAAGQLADPVALIDRQRVALLRELRDVQRAALDEPTGSVAALLLEGAVLRLQADLRWLEECARFWSTTERGGTR